MSLRFCMVSSSSLFLDILFSTLPCSPRDSSMVSSTYGNRCTCMYISNACSLLSTPQWRPELVVGQFGCFLFSFWSGFSIFWREWTIPLDAECRSLSPRSFLTPKPELPTSRPLSPFSVVTFQSSITRRKKRKKGPHLIKFLTEDRWFSKLGWFQVFQGRDYPS